MRSRAELRRSWALFESVFVDPLAGDADRLEAVLSWDPPTEDELHAAQLGEALVLLAEHRGVTLPPMPAWLDDLAGITEPARWCLAALLERAEPHGPVRWVADRLGWRGGDAWHPGDAIDELLRRRLVRGTSAGCVPVRRAA